MILILSFLLVGCEKKSTLVLSENEKGLIEQVRVFSKKTEVDKSEVIEGILELLDLEAFDEAVALEEERKKKYEAWFNESATSMTEIPRTFKVGN